MKKKTLLGVAAAAAVGAAGWYLAAGGRKNQIEHIRGRPSACWRCGGTSWPPCAPLRRRESWTPAPWGRYPWTGRRWSPSGWRTGPRCSPCGGRRRRAWLSSEPLDRLGVYSVPWRGSARPGVLYTEYLGSGWYAGYACLGWG